MDSDDSLGALRKQLLKSAREGVRQEFSGKDFHIVKAIGLLDDLDRMFNLMAEHCISWHSSHFPELKELVTDNEQMLRLISELGKRENFEQENVSEILGDEDLAERVGKASASSMGSEVSEKELSQFSVLAVNALKLKEERKSIEDFVSEKMNSLAPNFSQLAGSLLAARLLAKAGSLKSLALMPASKIQTLGAEKALFRHLRTRGKALPPKYGLIFQHSLIQQLKPWQQGSMARSLAGKISIAVKKDFFSKEPKPDNSLNDSLQLRFNDLGKKKQPVKKSQDGKFSRENPMLPRKFQQRPFQQDDSRRGGFEKRPFAPRGEFRPRRDGDRAFNQGPGFRPREGFRPRGAFRPRDGFRPVGGAGKSFYESPGMKKFNNSGVDVEKLKKSKDFRRNSFKKPGKLRFAKTKE